jgi:hypothetical protein
MLFSYIVDAVITSHPSTTYAIIKPMLQKYLAGACDRDGGRLKRSKMHNEISKSFSFVVTELIKGQIMYSE